MSACSVAIVSFVYPAEIAQFAGLRMRHRAGIMDDRTDREKSVTSDCCREISYPSRVSISDPHSV